MPSWSKAIIWTSSGYALLVIIMLIMLFIRRNTQPIKFRSPYMLLISGFGASTIVCWLFVYLIRLHDDIINHHAFCEVGKYIVWIVYPMLILPYMFRAYRIYHIFGEKHLVKLSDRNQYRSLVIREMKLLRNLTIVLCTLLIIMYIRDYTTWSFNILGYGCSKQDLVFWVVVHTCELVVMIYALSRLRNVRDDYGVSMEFRLVAAVWVIATLLQFGFGIKEKGSLLQSWFGGTPWSTNKYETISALLIIIRNVLIFIISIIMPVLQSFSVPFVPLWSNCDSLKSLEGVLKDIVCIQYFRCFLTNEKKVENILCWVEIELFCDILDENDLIYQAQRIYNKYMSEDAELEVDLPSDIKTRIYRKIHSGHVTNQLFAAVQSKLFQNMNELFPKFLASEACSECLKDLEQEERLKYVLEESGMI